MDGVRSEPVWDEDAAGMPDPWAHLRSGRISPYGPEGEILGIGNFAGGVRRASGWRRVVGVGVSGLLLISLLGSAVVSVWELAGADGPHVVQSPSRIP